MDSVLIVGGGGREHAIQKALLRSDRPLCLFAWPGNTGMEHDGCTLVKETITSWEQLADWACANEIDLTVIGPEVPLVEGVVDLFESKNLMVFGPNKAAAQIEGSESFAKNLMKKYRIPTADFEVVTTKRDALARLESMGIPIVIKVSGLAAGKGALVCDTKKDALAALDEIFDKKKFGEAGSTVVLEEKLIGEEASIFTLTDGDDWKLLPAAQDHKPVGDGDTGPNTGGMGAYCPAPLIDTALMKQIEADIIKPTIKAMALEGTPYKGLLYTGIIVTPEGPKVIEYNCRFGDPETQCVLPLISCDWFDVFQACIKNELNDVDWEIHPGSCVTVVLASNGYPGSYDKGKVITGIHEVDSMGGDIDVYHAGIRRDEQGRFITAGGRVCTVSAVADSLPGAIERAYEGVEGISFDGKMFRHDIGTKGVQRLKEKQ